MNISNITINNEGYVDCKSSFYYAQNVLNKDDCFVLHPGINKLFGEIDSGNWAISYLLSMYAQNPKDFILFDQPVAIVNNECISLEKLNDYSCYMDKSNSLFSSNKSVKTQIEKALAYSKLSLTSKDIMEIFQIDSERFVRPLSNTGNEIFKAMSAIGFSYKKEIFCFPWLSHKRFEYYHDNLTIPLKTLEKFNKMIILPIGLG